MMSIKIIIKTLFFITLLLLLASYSEAHEAPAFPIESGEEKEVPPEKAENKMAEDASLQEELAAAKEVARLTELLKLPSRKKNISNREIIWKLIELGRPAVPTLISEMERGDSSTLGVVIYCLGMIGDKRAIVPLYKFIPPVEDEEEPYGNSLKESICFSLGLLEDPNCIPLIMQGPYAANRMVGLGSITNIAAISTFLGEAAVEPLIDVINIYKNDKKVYGAIGALGKVADERAIPMLKSLLDHPDDIVKREAIEALAQIGRPSFSELIKPFLDSENDALREAAAESMYYLRDPGAIPKLTVLSAKDPVSLVRKKSLMALGIHKDEKAFQALLKAAYDQDPTVRTVSVDWIGRSGNKMGAATLRRKIKDQDVRVSIFAVNSLVKLLKDEAEDALIKLLNKESRWVIQREALKNLQHLQSKKAVDSVFSILEQKIAEKKEDRDFNNTLLETLFYLSELGDAKTLNSLKKLQSNVEKDDFRKMFDGAINDLALMIRNGLDVSKWIETLQHGDLGDQAVAIEMLGEIGDPSSVKPLIDHFGRVDVDVGSLIPKTLGKIKEASALPFLEDLLTSDLYEKIEIYPARVNAAWALGEIGKRSSIKALKEVLALYSGEPFTAIVAIAKLAGKEAIPDLYETKKIILKDPSKERMAHYDDINWLIRNLKNGWSISALDKEP